MNWRWVGGWVRRVEGKGKVREENNKKKKDLFIFEASGFFHHEIEYSMRM